MKKQSLKEQLVSVDNDTILHAYSCVKTSMGNRGQKHEEDDLERIAIKIYHMWLKDESDLCISRMADELAELIFDEGLEYTLGHSARILLERIY